MSKKSFDSLSYEELADIVLDEILGGRKGMDYKSIVDDLKIQREIRAKVSELMEKVYSSGWDEGLKEGRINGLKEASELVGKNICQDYPKCGSVVCDVQHVNKMAISALSKR